MLTSIYDVVFYHGFTLLGSFLFVDPVRLEPIAMRDYPIFRGGGDDVRSPPVASV